MMTMESQPGSRTEDALLAQSCAGDRSAFALLVERYWGRLYRWLHHLCHDRHQAEDLAQESFLKAYTALNSFTPGSNFQAWLFRIAYHAFLNQRRRKEPVRQEFPAETASAAPGPPELAMGQEALRELARALGRLPGEYRAAFLLRVEEGLSFREIATVLGLTEETARWRVYKAREKLLKVLEPHLRRDEL